MRVKTPRWLTGAIAGAGVFLLAVAMLLASRDGEPDVAPPDVAAAADVELAAPAEPVRKTRRAAPQTKRATEAKAADKPVDAVPARALAADAAAVRTASVEPAAPAKGSAAMSQTTLTGCLERDDDTYRLKNTEGDGAPKSRSWKSGFLRKGAAKVEVVDSSNRLRLENYLGQRVSITGTLSDREMQARSLRRVAASCE